MKFSEVEIMKVAIVLVSVALVFSGVAHADPNSVDTADQFLQRCRSNENYCLAYIKGVIDGTIWTLIMNHHKTICFSQAPSYLEIGEAYLSYLKAAALNSNADNWSRQTLSDDNMLVLQVPVFPIWLPKPLTCVSKAMPIKVNIQISRHL
jgi:hypothetical protein